MQGHPNFQAKYPLSTKLGVEPVTIGSDYRLYSDIRQHEGFDIDEVAEKLGPERFKAFESGVKNVMSVGHRTWPQDHPEPHKRGAEVHVVHAQDLETFLAGGN